MKENLFLPYREAANRNERETNKKEQVMSAMLDKICRNFIAKDAGGKEPIAASPASYEFVDEFFNKYHEQIIKELYGRRSYEAVGEHQQEDAKNFLMAALIKIREEAEGGQPADQWREVDIRAIRKPVLPPKPNMGYLVEWQREQEEEQDRAEEKQEQAEKEREERRKWRENQEKPEKQGEEDKS